MTPKTKVEQAIARRFLADIKKTRPLGHKPHHTRWGKPKEQSNEKHNTRTAE
jgi:hypothetical protein